jgi:methionyl-tRNA synthetase
MDLEEQEGVEKAGSHCEVCGVELTPDEQRDALTGGGPVLCKIHAAEVLLIDVDEGDAPPASA